MGFEAYEAEDCRSRSLCANLGIIKQYKQKKFITKQQPFRAPTTTKKDSIKKITLTPF